MSSKRVLILTGDGINCEMETAQAFALAGFETEVRHLNDVIRDRFSSDSLALRYSCLALPGGFSFGDDLASGKVLALKLTHGLKWDLPSYAARGGLVLGVCNGFQALIRMGVFGRTLSIAQNEQGNFLSTWVRVTPTGNKCVWTQAMGSVDLPIRHAEGRIVFATLNRAETLVKLERQGMMCLRYDKNPNGSQESLAGLTDSTGRIFGLMPHPEAFVRWSAHPSWTTQPTRGGAPGDGLRFFENAFKNAVAVNPK
jgi:phosphoribosylformylglycinamidine (FGAM) synthase-like amidotransferase family enzyme